MLKMTGTKVWGAWKAPFADHLSVDCPDNVCRSLTCGATALTLKSKGIHSVEGMATIRKRRGRWVADFVDQHGRRHVETPKGTFETLAHEKRAAEALLKMREGEVDSSFYVPPEDRLSFKEVAKLWIDSKVRLRTASRSDYETTLACYLVPYFGPRKYESITRLDIE